MFVIASKHGTKFHSDKFRGLSTQENQNKGGAKELLEPYIIQKYENALEWIKTSVNNGILPNDYIDLSIKWGHDLGKMSKSVQARRAIDATLAEIKIRQAQETAIQRRGRFQ